MFLGHGVPFQAILGRLKNGQFWGFSGGSYTTVPPPHTVVYFGHLPCGINPKIGHFSITSKPPEMAPHDPKTCFYHVFSVFWCISDHFTPLKCVFERNQNFRFWPILADFGQFFDILTRVTRMPQDQVVKGVHTNHKNSKMVKMSSNNPKQSYKVALVPLQSVPGPYQDPLRWSLGGLCGAPGASRPRGGSTVSL